MSAVADKSKIGILWETGSKGCAGPSCQSVFSVVPKLKTTDAAAAAAATTTRRLSAWAGGAAPAVVDTNAPVMRWHTQVDSQGTFAYKVTVHSASDGAAALLWTSGEVWQGNWPATSPAFPGLCVYAGPALAAGATYTFTVTETQAADSNGHNASRSWSGGAGSFKAAATLPSAKAELLSELRTTNATKLWNTSMSSIWQRVEPSGFLPTSVSNGYGGITSEFVRDGAGMIVGMLELGPTRYDVARSAMRFMLHGLACTQNAKIVAGCSVAGNMSRPPEVLVGDCPDAKRKAGTCKYNKKIVGVSSNEETDGTFYVIAGWGRVVTVTGDAALETDFYLTLKT